MKKLNYDKKFYKQQRASNISSAQVIVPLVFEFFREGGRGDDYAVIDLGCGSGNWLSVFKKYGWKVTGVDGGNVPDDVLMIERSEFITHDFRKKYKDSKKYTLAMSLECAEHIPEENVDEFLDSLTSLSNVILFSAAIPHQRGKGHVNEQYPSYWIEKFDRLGFQVYDVIRHKVWNDDRVRGFYAQNIFLYVKRDSGEYNKFLNLNEENITSMYDVVHPEIWESVNRFKLVKLMDSMHENKIVSWIYYKLFKKE